MRVIMLRGPVKLNGHPHNEDENREGTDCGHEDVVLVLPVVYVLIQWDPCMLSFNELHYPVNYVGVEPCREFCHWSDRFGNSPVIQVIEMKALRSESERLLFAIPDTSMVLKAADRLTSHDTATLASWPSLRLPP